MGRRLPRRCLLAAYQEALAALAGGAEREIRIVEGV
jgi:hypothetical protein